MKGTCDTCRQSRTVHKDRNTGKAICTRCHGTARYRDSSTHEKCFVCDKVKAVGVRNETGKAICMNCCATARRRDSSTHEQCFVCDRVKAVVTRNEDGKAICESCHRRGKINKCAECEKTKVIQALGLCYACYQSQRRTKANRETIPA